MTSSAFDELETQLAAQREQAAYQRRRAEAAEHARDVAVRLLTRGNRRPDQGCDGTVRRIRFDGGTD